MGPSFFLWFGVEARSEAQNDWVFGVQGILQFGLGVVGGKLTDLGHTRAVLFTGSLIYIFSFIMLSFVKTPQVYQLMLAQGVGMGIGGGLCFVPALVTAANSFPGQQATAMGVVTSAVLFGRAASQIISVYLPVELVELIDPNFGITEPSISGPSVIRIITGILAAILMVGNALISAPARPSKPSATGTRLLHTPYALSIAAAFLGRLGGLWLMNYIPFFISAEEVELITEMEDIYFAYDGREGDYLTYAALLAIPYFAGAVGSVIAGLFADKYGVVGTYIICELLAAASSFILGAKSSGGVIIFCALFGFFFGSTTALFAPVITTILPSEADRGIIIGVAMAPLTIVSLIDYSPLGEKIAGPDLNWGKGVAWTAVFLFSGASVQIIARHVHRRATQTSSPEVSGSY
ncbi:hypothetical protein GYMLUDRAFT_42180 [Collybiopsis luxurians FD-317 M1]|uniref:Major facilitator superfamily (MFS) profile domain-containing protein n=1 Tax=Collybiopsis luxurians FD-317 M1 TaxID=944289 RepID=A0A0D0CHV4_9AGAR|nr:hypothetical protein GYMLUDRAFT_42180 [Collybiopsis luxurians FD-317 M1]